MTTLEIFRPPTTSIVVINIDEKTVFSKRLMAEHFIKCEFVYASVIALQIGDFITYLGENYYINRLPSIVKLNDSTFQYSIVFESVLYDLNRKLFISDDGLADFSYNGSATDFLTNIVASINEISSGWSVGTVDASEDITLQFANETCRAALTRVSEAFKMEFSLSGKAISLKKSVGSTTSLRFQYGQGLGLYNLTRQQVQDQNILTKVFGFGSTKNITYSYRSGAKRLVFESAGNRYLTKNTALYGTIEGQFTDDNIFPQRTGTLSYVNYLGTYPWDANEDYIADSAIDFDLNDYKIDGKGLGSIVFKSGDLAGVECEIWKFDNANKRFYITPFTDTDGAVRPDTANHPHIGDSYTIVNISMPASYVTAAETALQVATQAYIDENSVPMVVYTVDIDPKYAESQGISLNAGDKVTVVDTDLGINSLIRVSAIEFPLVNPYQIKAVIADFVPYTLQERIVKAAISNKKETIFVDRRQAEAARRNTVNQKSLKDLLFDTDMYFDATNIKPLSIETAYLAVGTKSSDFWLSNVTIKANYEGNANTFRVSAGSLVHLQIEIAGLGYTWVVSPYLEQYSLTPTSAYYLYARCSKTALTGNWVLSTSQLTVESESGFYHFLTGMLFAVADGYRDFDFTYGMTYIHGNQIKTGIVSSIDGLNYFDLTQGKFKVGDTDSSLDWNVTAANVLTLKGALVQSPGGSTASILVSRGPYDAGITYYIGESVTYGGSTWNWINATPASGHTPAEDAYWTLASSGGIGPQGTSILFQGSYASEAALIADKGALQDGWGYYNTADKKSYVYYSSAWHQMSVDGGTGATGGAGPGVVYRGAFDSASYYFNNSLRRDIVKYSGAYYLYKAADNSSGIWDAGNWDSFGASFSSVATELLLATYATIENLGVRYFEGVPVGTGAYLGAISIEGNQIWENTIDSDSAWVMINYKGFNGGTTRSRNLILGDGMGNTVVIINSNGFSFNGSKVFFPNIPTSDPHVNSQIWRNGTTIFISNG